MPIDPEKAKKLLAEAGYPNGFEFEWTTSQNESWGLPIVEAVIPMLAKVGIKVKPKLVEVTVLTDIAGQGRVPGRYQLEPDRPGFAGAAAVLLFQDAAHGLQLHCLQQPRLRQADRRGRPDDRHRQAQRPAAAGQQHPLRRSAGLVLQLQQGGAGLSAVGPRPAGQPDRDHAPVSPRTSGSTTSRRRSDRRRPQRLALDGRCRGVRCPFPRQRASAGSIPDAPRPRPPSRQCRADAARRHRADLPAVLRPARQLHLGHVGGRPHASIRR